MVVASAASDLVAAVNSPAGKRGFELGRRVEAYTWILWIKVESPSRPRR